jgi:membrane protein DedA with SNARE-associated domain
MHSFLVKLFAFATSLVLKLGYAGIFFGMTLESSAIPIPSEAIMGFAGYMVSQGHFNFWLAVIAGTLGNFTGATILYMIGKHGGIPVLEKYGKWIHINKKEMDKAEKWFNKYGEVTIFVAQMMPVVRSFIAFPAGALKIDYKKYITYSMSGIFLWCLLLVYVGNKLGDNWEKITEYMKPFQNVIIVLLAALFVYFVYSHFFKKEKLAA